MVATHLICDAMYGNQAACVAQASDWGNNQQFMDTPFPTLSIDLLDALPQAGATLAPAPPAAISAPSVTAPALAAAAQQVAATPMVAVPSASMPAAERPVVPGTGLREALALALELAPQVIDNLVGRALLGMDRQSTAHPDAAQRSLLDSSAVAMDANRRRWSKQFTALLRVAFAHPPAADAALPKADVRICASEMAQLDSLVLAAGSKRGNPLGPASYVRAMFELISRSEARQEQRQVWSHFLLGALGTQLAWAYLQMGASLRTPGSRDVPKGADAKEFAEYADYVYGLGGKAPPDLPAPPMPKPEVTPEMRALAQEAQRTVKKLRGVLGMPEPEPVAEGDDEMALMMQDIEESERLMIEVSKRGLQIPTDETPAEVGDKLTRQIERLIDDYRNVTTSALARVPTPLRDALEKLQQPLERLAAVDASLVSKSDHAVRILLDAIAKRSLLFANETTEGFSSFFTPVQKMLEAVSQVAQPSAKVYEQALVRLQPLWAQQDEELKKLDQLKERSLAQMEVRKQLASRLAFELVSRRDASDAPVPVKQFLMGPWAQVLARAQLHPQHAQDEQRYEYTVALLLWSVSARRAGSHKARLVELSTELMQALRVGLASVEHPQGNIDAFLQELRKLHEAVMSSDIEDDADDTYPPDQPTSADISDMMMLSASPSTPPPPPAPPSYQSDLNLL